MALLLFNKSMEFYLLSDPGAATNLVTIGKISFNPKEVLGHGAEGTFVFR